MYFTLLLIILSGFSWSFDKGFNQAWLKNNYAHQWLDKYYDEKYSEDLILLNKDANSTILRIWLYEGAQLLQFDFNSSDGSIKLKPEIIMNLKKFLTLARKHNVKISLAFLDGNAFSKLNSSTPLHNFWWNVFNDKYSKLDHFYTEAIAPVYALIDLEFRDVVTQIDLVNEVNALAKFKLFEKTNVSMPKFLCKLGQNKPVPVTASLGWNDAEELFASGFLKDSCLDYTDLHLYNDTGAIPKCSSYKRLAAKGQVFQLGEFGQASMEHSDSIQGHITKNFLANAKRCGFKSALAWRLDDTRVGHNVEARFSYLNNGVPREAYYTFRD